MKAKAKCSLFKGPIIKIKAMLSDVSNNPAMEIKDKEAEMVMEIYDSMQTGSYTNKRNEANRFYNGCVMELSLNTNIQVFDGYAILIENTIKEVRIDEGNKLEKHLLKNLNISPMIKSLIFELSQNIVTQRTVLN
ncbi:MAG: hypothetical protein NTY74_11360 [Ignavibacteriae bacterium]|nr:hypothetical protein [Ignavibacteriota bacterium]